MPPNKGPVAPPPRKSESIELVTGQATTGWRHVVAARKNSPAVDWDRPTKAPYQSDPKCHQLKGELATIVRDGVEHEQWQYELAGGARIWFYVEGNTVKVLNVFTRFTNHTG